MRCCMQTKKRTSSLHRYPTRRPAEVDFSLYCKVQGVSHRAATCRNIAAQSLAQAADYHLCTSERPILMQTLLIRLIPPAAGSRSCEQGRIYNVPGAYRPARAVQVRLMSFCFPMHLRPAVCRSSRIALCLHLPGHTRLHCRIPLSYLSHTKRFHAPEVPEAPMIVFINSRSGGRAGAKLTETLYRTLGHAQVSTNCGIVSVKMHMPGHLWSASLLSRLLCWACFMVHVGSLSLLL